MAAGCSSKGTQEQIGSHNPVTSDDKCRYTFATISYIGAPSSFVRFSLRVLGTHLHIALSLIRHHQRTYSIQVDISTCNDDDLKTDKSAIVSHDCPTASNLFASKLCTCFEYISFSATNFHVGKAWQPASFINLEKVRRAVRSRTPIRMTESIMEPSTLCTSSIQLIHTSASYVTTVRVTQGSMGFERIAVAK